MLQIQETFQKGNPHYAPAMMFYPNDSISYEELSFQLHEIKKSGVNEFYIHPAYGLRGNYLDETFFAMIRHVVREAAQLEMKYWIYDEYNWPSGTAGGYLIKDQPWTRMTAVGMMKCEIQPGATLSEALPPQEHSNTKFLAACTLNNGTKIWVDVTYTNDHVLWENKTDQSQTLLIFFTIWSAGVLPSARWSEFAWGQEGYLDTLDPEAVQEFIRYTHEQYKMAVGEYFGTIVKGVFTDETAAMLPASPLPGITLLAWSRKFEQTFLEQHGYLVQSILPELFVDSDDIKTAKARFDYWNTVTFMYNNAYMNQIYEWCRTNHLIYTGHGGGEESLRFQLTSFTDMYEIFSRFDMPGIDSIFSCQRINDYDFNITPKLASSAARFLGKKRLLCETYTGSGWDLTLRQMKRIANRLILLGVNYIQFMGAYYSLNSFRKSSPGGYPPSHNWHNTLFRHYDAFNRYVSGMSWLVAETSVYARALMLNPMATAKALAGGPTLREGGEHMGPLSTHPLKTQDLTAQGVVNALIDLHVPFEIAFEQVFDKAEVADGCIWMCNTKYDVLILPAVQYVTQDTARVIGEFARQGGRLILINGIPLMTIDTLEPTGLADLTSLENVHLIEADCYDLTGSNEKAPAGSFTLALRHSLRDMPPYIADIAYEDGILSAIRRAGDDYFIILVNDREEKKTARGTIVLDRPVSMLDPDTGLLKPAKLLKIGQATEFSVDLEGFETAVAIISVDTFIAPDLEEPTHVMPGAKIIELNHGFDLRPCGKNWLLPIAKAVAGTDLVRCVNPIWNSEKDHNGWQIPAGIQHPSGHVTAVYDFTIRSKPASVELVSESEYPVAWFVNGKWAPNCRYERLWNKDNTVIEIGDFLIVGENRLTAVGEYPPYQAPFGVPFAGLRGDFLVLDDLMVTENAMIESGDKPSASPTYWNGQGYTYYSGDLIYSCSFEMDKMGPVRLSLKTPDVAEVFINGASAGRRNWEPYIYNLSSWVIEGKNRLEILVTSTLGNRFYRPTLSGLAAAPVLRVGSIM